MITTEVIVIGGGQAGLAMSRCLAGRGIGHVVLERGRIGERWRSERWDSLRLLTPNWQSRLPGFSYDGPDPDGYMTMPEVTAFLDRFAASFGAPVVTGVEVGALRRCGRGFVATSEAGKWFAPAVVVATGHCDTPLVPAFANRLPGHLRQIVPSAYRRPTDLPDAGVLVVGASASGLQLADELQASGRPVTLAVGQHTRLPRRYLGRDICYWLDAMGLLNEPVECVADASASRSQPSLQLVGRPDHATLDLATLSARGVKVVGRVLGVDGHRWHLADDLVKTTAAADAKLALLLDRIDRFAARLTAAPVPDERDRFEPLWPAFTDAPRTIDTRRSGIASVVWATGYTRRYPWLKVPVLDQHGEIIHLGGITTEPGLYVIGLHFLRRRNSSFLDGVGDDAEALATQVARYLSCRRAA